MLLCKQIQHLITAKTISKTIVFVVGLRTCHTNTSNWCTAFVLYHYLFISSFIYTKIQQNVITS